MTRNKVYLIIESILLIALAALLSAAAIRIYNEGTALRQSGDSLAWIYTKELAAERFAPIAPVFFGAVGMTIAGLILGIKYKSAALKASEICISPVQTKNSSIKWVRIIILAAAAGLIIAGVFNGGMRDVLVKAINLCTECVGLG